jgi:hypothetical protein
MYAAKLECRALFNCRECLTYRNSVGNAMNHYKYLLFFLLLTLLLGCDSKAEFKPFYSESGQFSIQTPEKLAYQSKAFTFGEHEVTMHSFGAQKNGVVYGINYFDIPETVNTELREQQRDTSIPGTQAMLDGNGWVPYETIGNELTKPDNEPADGQFYKIRTGKQTIMVKVFWYKNRVYQLITAYPLKPSYHHEQEARTFLYSFKIQLQKPT